MSLIEEYLKHYDELLSFATRLVNNAELANDVVQDTYFRLLKSSVTPEAPLPFIFTAVRWTASNLNRGRKSFINAELPIEPAAGPEQVLEFKQNVAALITLIPNLPPKQRLMIEASLNGIGPRIYAKSNGLHPESAATNYRVGLMTLKQWMVS
ncbi:MAG: RNA polymerase sigma factor [Candidatus Paceibacterota bacterium]